MDSSRRAVESYWRSRMIDAATSDEDKVTPVYKLEEVCELLRSSHVSIVKEIADYVLKRLDHKSPIVKQKALRLIKYAVGKSGADFRREMQRNSVAVRQLFHYKGQLDPLKADALNKAVRDTAHEASAAIFSAEETRAAPSENLSRRIQGFGNTNFEMHTEDKKSFISEVVDLGSASIKQGFSSFKQAHSTMVNDTGNYKSPNLRRSLTTETGHKDKYDPAVIPNDKLISTGIAKNGSSGPWGQESRVSTMGTTYGDSSSSYGGSKSREEKLLETIVTSGGVRLQPTRDAIHIFLVEAAKLDAVPLSFALESKLQSPSWQVRMKSICVLEAILRRKDDEAFFIVATYFSENKNVILSCTDSPQASLREKANRVLNLLDDGQADSSASHQEESVKSTATAVQMPNLIDTDDSSNFYGEEENLVKMQNYPNNANLNRSAAPLIDDIFGDMMGSGGSASEQKAEDDPFANVSFHTSNRKEHVDDLFQGIAVDKHDPHEIHTGANRSEPEIFDMFGSDSTPVQGNHAKDVHEIMAGLSINGNSSQIVKEKTKVNDVIGQTLGTSITGAPPIGPMLYNFPPGMMYNQGFPSHTANYGAMGNLLAQQQFLASMANFQQPGNFNSQCLSAGLPAGTKEGGYSSPLPDVFHPNIPTQSTASIMGNSTKDDTRAFDFITDHLAAARDPKRVT